MEDQPKVTVTVAVYNTEQFIRRCLDSLIAQTLEDLEILVVDDGSTDTSGRICDEYALKDSRIKVIHKKNEGLGSARQVGLENATGEYIIPCDSDDWVEPTMYADMYLKAKEDDADIVICDYCMNYTDGKEVKCHEYSASSNQTDIIKSVLNHRICCNVWNKLVRRAFYLSHNITWEIGINQGEDALILLKKLLYPTKVSYISEVYYHYRRDMNSGSYTNNLTLLSFDQILYVNNWKKNNLPQRLFEKELFVSDINVAFAALRTKGMTKEKYAEYCKPYLNFSKFIKYHIWGLKAVIVCIANLNFLLASKMLNYSYSYFYK